VVSPASYRIPCQCHVSLTGRREGAVCAEAPGIFREGACDLSSLIEYPMTFRRNDHLLQAEDIRLQLLDDRIDAVRRGSLRSKPRHLWMLYVATRKRDTSAITAAARITNPAASGARSVHRAGVANSSSETQPALRYVAGQCPAPVAPRMPGSQTARLTSSLIPKERLSKLVEPTMDHSPSIHNTLHESSKAGYS